MENPMFSFGKLFGCAKDFIIAVREYNIKNHRKLKFKANDKDKIKVVCNIPQACEKCIFLAIL